MWSGALTSGFVFVVAVRVSCSADFSLTGVLPDGAGLSPALPQLLRRSLKRSEYNCGRAEDVADHAHGITFPRKVKTIVKARYGSTRRT